MIGNVSTSFGLSGLIVDLPLVSTLISVIILLSFLYIGFSIIRALFNIVFTKPILYESDEEETKITSDSGKEKTYAD